MVKRSPDKETPPVTGCGCVISVIAAIVLMAIGWHYIKIQETASYINATTSDGLFGERIGEVVPSHSEWGGRCKAVESWGDENGPMITVFLPQKPSEFFDEYRAYVLPRSKRTFKLEGQKSCLDAESAACVFDEVSRILRRKYGKPSQENDVSVVYKFGHKEFFLESSCERGQWRVKITAQNSILARKELWKECAIKACEKAAEDAKEQERAFNRKSRGL